MFIACRSCNIALVTMLVFCGSRPDIPDSEGSLPLHYAAQYGLEDFVNLFF